MPSGNEATSLRTSAAKLTAKPLLLAIAGPLLVISAGWYYNSYLKSLLWHAQGHHAELAGRRVQLPLLWRSERDDGSVGNSLTRACPGLCLLGGAMTATSLPSRSTRATEEQEIDAVQSVATRIGALPTAYRDVRVIQLPTRDLHLICIKNEVQPPGEAGLIELNCYAAKVPVQFSFFGRLAQEKEAEAILSSMQ